MAENKKLELEPELEKKQEQKQEPELSSEQPVQNSNTFVSDTLNLHKTTTLNRLTKYEKARIIGTRASQIQNGMPPVFIKNNEIVGIPDDFKDVVKSTIDIAKLELKLKSTPLVIRRIMPSGKIIDITTQELE